jgi:hypothetical protein
MPTQLSQIQITTSFKLVVHIEAFIKKAVLGLSTKQSSAIGVADS